MVLAWPLKILWVMQSSRLWQEFNSIVLFQTISPKGTYELYWKPAFDRAPPAPFSSGKLDNRSI
jgi:hypothetical protein